MREETLSGVMVTYVDYTMGAGNEGFNRLPQSIGESFDTKTAEFDKFSLAGVYFEQRNGEVVVSQVRKARPHDISFTDYKSVLMQLGWLTITRPDISFAVATGAQVTSVNFTRDLHEMIKKINKVAKTVRDSSERGLCYKKMDSESFQVRVYSNGSFANNADMSSQFGCVIFLYDSRSNCLLLSFRSYKCRRVTSTVLAAGEMAFADAFDHAHLIQDFRVHSSSRLVDKGWKWK